MLPDSLSPHKLLTGPCLRSGAPMDVLVLIDKLDALVRNARRLPLRSDVRVDKEELSDLLNELRVTTPGEIKQARWIVKERQEMLAAAEREAERIFGEARERQTQLVVEHPLSRQAELATEDIIDDARAEEREIRLAAEDYADEILSTFEANLSKFIAAVQRGRERLQARTNRTQPSNTAPILPVEIVAHLEGGRTWCRSGLTGHSGALAEARRPHRRNAERPQPLRPARPRSPPNGGSR